MESSNRGSWDEPLYLDEHSQATPEGRNSRVNEDRVTAETVSYDRPVPPPVLLSTIDTYFKYCHNQPYSFFHEENFRRRLSEGSIPDHLLLAVLATAVRFSEDPFFKGNTWEASTFYANKSWKSIVASCFARNETSNVMTVQTITLLAIFDFTAGHSRHGSAWVKVGLSVRIAQDLRLMMDANTNISLADQEERRRVFWSLYLLDRIVSCGRARPPAILEASCQLQLPCDEDAWKAGVWQQTDTLDQLSNKALLNRDNIGPFALVVIMAYILSRAAQYMLQEYNIRSRDPPWDPNSDFASISSDLLYIESQFELQNPVKELMTDNSKGKGTVDLTTYGLAVFSRALFYLCHCLLNHPFLLRHRLDISGTRPPETFLSRSFDFGRLCAKRLTRHLRDAQAAGCRLNASFYGYCAVVAGAIQALYLHSTDKDIQRESIECVQLNLQTLEEVGEYWMNVSTMSDALTQFSLDTSRFSILTSTEPEIPRLDQVDQEIMWSLVDYSTMSNAVKLTEVYHSDLPPTMDTSLYSWLDLFSSEGIVLAEGGNFENQV
ncbi:hypothetical protein NECHADRAFT_44766 [Paecilomyces variotii No. 5]|uniref:Xylanolytic transcriptional activator regulatory domain-containing protein n=1 Tax=Byssochlamys spectabilis (strain No. 5 / NBRC 109023) TaxID=1356009 RepID=V5FB07_BYSSN|nr:hypothetical protein NECHADRAFT_44766 [Paecilomyces variotii No. 5]